MKKSITLSLLTATVLMAGGDIAPVEPTVETAPVNTNTLAYAFANGTVSGQLRAGYINYSHELAGEPDSFSTALGGQLKYETGRYHGFNLGAALYTSHSISWLSGEKSKDEFNEELSGGDHYDVLGEAYIGYAVNSFAIKVGRQLIDTPYADSDDIRMTPNTFEGVVASYGMGDLSLIGAYLTKWQGPDAEEYDFVDLLGPDADGLAMLAATYAVDGIEAGLWYYGADKTADIFYGDIIGTYALSEGIELIGGLQYANQSEKDNSGIEGTLYGAKVELVFSGITLGAAYNTLDVDDGKEYFGGFGGGVGFVNMDETTAGTFTVSQGADSYKLAIVYDFAEIGVDGLTAEYHYGHGEGNKNHEIDEQNFIVSYANNNNWDIEAIYSTIDDKLKDFGEDANGNPSDSGFDRLLVRANYNF